MSQNVTHTKKIARALAERTGMPYTRARKQVVAAMEVGLLPEPYSDAALPGLVDILVRAKRPAAAQPVGLSVVGGPGSQTVLHDPPLEVPDVTGMVEGSRAGQVTIAVTSAVGGTGKSMTALMLASTIARASAKAVEEGRAEKPLKVVLVDMDSRGGQVATLLGRYAPTVLNIHLVPDWGAEAVLADLVRDEKLGIDALLAAVRPRDAEGLDPDFYRQVIAVLKTTHDVVVLDSGVDYLDPLVGEVCLPEATAVLMVTTLATTSVHGMARALREFTMSVEDGGRGVARDRIGIVVNKSVTDVGMDREQVEQAALSVPIVAAVPLASKDVLTAANFNRMHTLGKHPTLGPAYFTLARNCMPHVALSPLAAQGAWSGPDVTENAVAEGRDLANSGGGQLIHEVTTHDVAASLRRAAVLIASGLPLPACINLAARSAKAPVLQAAMADAAALVKEGWKMHEAFGAYPVLFDDFVVASVFAGEHAGSVGSLLTSAADAIATETPRVLVAARYAQGALPRGERKTLAL